MSSLACRSQYALLLAQVLKVPEAGAPDCRLVQIVEMQGHSSRQPGVSARSLWAKYWLQNLTLSPQYSASQPHLRRWERA